MTEINPSEVADQLLATNDELARRLQSISTEAWNRRIGPDEWSPAEVVGHMAELELHWAHMASAVAQRPGLEVGRPLEDADRLAGPDQTAGLSPSEGVARLTSAGKEAAEILRAIPPEAWSIAGQRDGEPRTVAELVHRSVLQHARIHVDQCLAALEGQTAN